ncbi:hypothetical protein Y001_05225 [Staphylococcus aureus MUF256]|nr:hypothetical protein Y001_05225 [Staphylococcus aureus MUF256]EWG56484.1 hypothetical protein Y000_07150 [Staphylococcus aureus MUF168]
MKENLEKYIRSLPLIGLIISIFFNYFILLNLSSRRKFLCNHFVLLTAIICKYVTIYIIRNHLSIF